MQGETHIAELFGRSASLDSSLFDRLVSMEVRDRFALVLELASVHKAD
jgi:hypothetical protein